MKHLFVWVLGYLTIVMAALYQAPSELTIASLSGGGLWLMGAVINHPVRIRLCTFVAVAAVLSTLVFYLALHSVVAMGLILMNLVAAFILCELLREKVKLDVMQSPPQLISGRVMLFLVLPSFVMGAVSAAFVSSFSHYSWLEIFQHWLFGNVLALLMGVPFLSAYVKQGKYFLAQIYTVSQVSVALLCVGSLVVISFMSWHLFIIATIALLVLSAIAYGSTLLALLGYLLGGAAYIILYANLQYLEENTLILGSTLFLTLVMGLLIATSLCRYKQSIARLITRLKKLKTFNKQAFELSPELILVLDSNGIVIDASEGFLSAVGLNKPIIQGKNVTLFLSEPSLQSFLSNKLDYKHKFSESGLEIIGRNARKITADLKATVFESDSGYLTVCFLHDISEQLELADVLEQEKELLEVTLSSIGDGVICTDVNSKVTYMNPVAEAVLAKLTRDVKGLPFDEVMPLYNEDTKKAITGLTDECIKNNQLMSLPELTCVKNHLRLEFAIQDSISPIYLKNGEIAGAVMVFQDVTESRIMSRKLTHMAHHDILTGLPNRLLLQERLGQFCIRAQREGHKFAVVFVDLDNFKKINDSLGHDVGDLMLKKVASRFTNGVRSVDTVARMGGDEFVLILDAIKDKHQVAKVVNKILNIVSGCYELEKVQVELSISAGIAMYPQDGGSPEMLMKHADTAMYRAKKVSKSDYQFYSIELDHAAELRIEQEAAIANALKDKEFIPYYQPVVNAQSFLLEKLEMLARWHHRGKVKGPESFISIAEEANLIDKVSHQLLLQAFVDFSSWLKKMPELVLSVNLSVSQLVDPQFITTILMFLEKNNIPPSNLEIEITESSLASNLDVMKKTLIEIQQRGISIAIDDFGTGYSSLSYLKDLNFDTIKVDRKFVADLSESRKKGELALVIVNMAKSLHVNCVAEGVESQGQANILAEAGCQQLQGYYFSKPKSAADIDSIIMAGLSINHTRTLQ
ncbi:bifunctional diguanylate cyclase/phosphodiesterase [Pseudoalteromonas sp. S16_S37]|uniref:bifunctional diguanylate cyclase/phosphodiesterase n=1 Tax=Pseudoalteromonas sp. S16_S37 TaxID=2720228 RepID=UPI00168040D5|nr:EAL domain-containing protein [Pseudoalteromonas sp. S16_S37]MBD1584342.1 EAL domain-containing protein [Pseudoalteromonas sp. S16_S37]